jgi:hypothetical protein
MSEGAAVRESLASMARRGRLPTPTASLVGSNLDLRKSGDGRTKPNTLGWWVADSLRLPTPCASMADKGGRGELIGALRGTKGCRTESMRLPTPRARGWKGDGKDCLPSALGTGGSLHPRFVEWMMGFPPGWTDEAGDDETGTG